LRISVVTSDHVIAELPHLKPSSELADEPVDLFVCAAGFEERAVAGASELLGRGLQVRGICVLTYPSNLDDNAPVRRKLDAVLDQFGPDPILVDTGSTDADFDREFALTVEKFGTRQSIRVIFDVSACSGRVILRVLRVLFALATGGIEIDLTVLYTQALEYAPSAADAQRIIAEAGQDEDYTVPATLGLDFDADEVTHIVERAGQHVDNAPDRAVVICGFNADRARASLDLIDTAFNVDAPHPRVTYIVGRPPRDEDAWRLQAMIDINSAGFAHPAIEPSVASTLDYRETLRLLEAVYEETAGRHKLTILPFGSKMQILAVALFCEGHPDVRVQMLAPSRYKGAQYSSGVRAVHVLNVGDLATVAPSLRSVGELDIRENPTDMPHGAKQALSRTSTKSVRLESEL
jgi:hypothetical protein